MKFLQLKSIKYEALKKKFFSVYLSLKSIIKTALTRYYYKNEICKLRTFVQLNKNLLKRGTYRFTIINGKPALKIIESRYSNNAIKILVRLLTNLVFTKITINATLENAKGSIVMILHDGESYRILDIDNSVIYCFFSEALSSNYVRALSMFNYKYLAFLESDNNYIAEKYITHSKYFTNSTLEERIRILLTNYLLARKDYSVNERIKLSNQLDPSNSELENFIEYRKLYEYLKINKVHDSIPIAYVHGDFSLSNFLYDDKTYQGIIIDFEDIHKNVYFVDLYLPIIRLLQNNNIAMDEIISILKGDSFINIDKELRMRFHDDSNISLGTRLIISYLCLIKSRYEYKSQIGITNGVLISEKLLKLLTFIQ